MSRLISAHLVWIGLIAGMTAVGVMRPASAQARCPEGRTLSGACVNPLLAQVQRKQAIVNVQSRLSMQTPLNGPSEDYMYPLTHNPYEPTTYVPATRNVAITTGSTTVIIPLRLTPRLVPGPR